MSGKTSGSSKLGSESSAIPPQPRYTAFISYRQVEPDQTWAKWLHTSLETYRIPRTIHLDGRSTRLGTVFRDNEELAAASDLKIEIEQALRDSGHLIVICSPNATNSAWVNKEIEFFHKLGRSDRVLALLVDGEPEEAFPSALREISGVATSETEPLAADVRTSAGESDRLRRRKALLRIAARLIGCSFDELYQRHAERRRKRLYQAGVAAAFFASILLAAVAFGVYERQIAREREMQAKIERGLRIEAAEATRQRDLERERVDQLEESLRRGRAEAATEEVATQLAGLRRRALWSTALEQLAAAKTLLHPHLDADLIGELSHEERKIQVLKEMDEIRMRKAAIAAEDPSGVWKAVDIREAYREAFLRAGYHFSAGNREAIIENMSAKLISSDIKDDLIAALDDWAWGVRTEFADVLWETTARASGNNWRRHLRVISLSAPESLALSREIPIRKFSPAVVIGLGTTMRLFLNDKERHAVSWLEEGATHRPADFWVNFYLGIEYQRLEEYESAAGAFRASLALRPNAPLPRKCLIRCMEEIKRRRPVK